VVSAWWTEIIEDRYCICGAAARWAFPYGTRPIVRKRRCVKWEVEHQGEGHGLCDLETWRGVREVRHEYV
jgi:hypothetical protein